MSSTTKPTPKTHHVGPAGLQRTNTAPATATLKRHADERHVADPIRLAKATRVVRVALSTGAITVADLNGGAIAEPIKLAKAARVVRLALSRGVITVADLLRDGASS